MKREMCRDCGQAHEDPAVCRDPTCECPECPECGDCPRCNPKEYARRVLRWKARQDRQEVRWE